MFPRLTKSVAFLKLWDRIGREEILAPQTALAQNHITVNYCERRLGLFLPVMIR